MDYVTAIGMGVSRAGTTRGRAKDPVAATVSAAYWAAATACLAYIACRMAAGTGAGRTGSAPGRAKGPVTTVVSVACRQTTDKNYGLVGEKGRLVVERDALAREAEDLQEEGGEPVIGGGEGLSAGTECLAQEEPEGDAGGRV